MILKDVQGRTLESNPALQRMLVYDEHFAKPLPPEEIPALLSFDTLT